MKIEAAWQAGNTKLTLTKKTKGEGADTEIVIDFSAMKQRNGSDGKLREIQRLLTVTKEVEARSAMLPQGAEDNREKETKATGTSGDKAHDKRDKSTKSGAAKK